MSGQLIQVISKHDVGEHEIYVMEEDGKLHHLCTIPFDKSEVLPLITLLRRVLGVVQSAATGKTINWAEIAGLCRRDIAVARQQPKAKKFDYT